MAEPATRLSRAAAVLVAVVAVSAMCGLQTCAADERTLTSHVVIGVTPESSFDVALNGEPVDGSPFTSCSLGILAFEVDESSLPPGTRTVAIGEPPELVVSGVTVDSVTTTSALITWETNRPASSVVEYGTTEAYGEQETSASLVTSHSVKPQGLTPGTLYHFRVSGVDSGGQSAASADSTFETALEPLSITDVSVDSVGVSWAAVSWRTGRPATSLVEYGEGKDYGQFTPADTTLTTAHEVLIEGLSASTEYHWRAHSDDGLTGPAVSGDLVFTTDALPPLTVFGVDVTSTGTDSATVGWSTNRPATSRVEYGLSDQYGSTSGTDTTLSTGHLVTLSDLEPGSTYHFRVWSSEDGSPGVCSSDHTFETERLPLLLDDVTVAQVGQTWAVINWSTSRPASARVDFGPTSDYGQVETPPYGFAAEHSATLSGLSEGALYHFMVSSEDEYGMIASSDDSTLQTLEAELTGPPVIQDVSFDVESATSVLVTWTTDRPASSLVRYGTDGTMDCSTAVDTVETTEHCVPVWPVVPRIEYDFVVVSACGADTTECAPMSFVAELPQVQESQIVPVEIIKVDIDPDDTVAEVVWASDRPCSSWVELGASADYEESYPGLPLGESVYAARIQGLLPGTTYHLRVSAWHEACGEVAGDDHAFSTSLPHDGDAPAPPTGLACQLLQDAVRLTWAASPEDDLAGYRLYRARQREGEIDWSRAVALNGEPVTETEYIDVTAERGTSYAYAVTAVDTSGNESAHSASAGATLPAAGPAALSLSTYPNPTSSSATFACALPPGVEEGRLRIFSVSGRVVLDAPVSGDSGTREPGAILEWDGRGPTGWPVAEGVYLCELRAGGGTARRKLTVVR